MSNTTAKVNSYIAMGYSILASDMTINEIPENNSEESEEDSALYNEIMNENLLPANKQVMSVINISESRNGLRI